MSMPMSVANAHLTKVIRIPKFLSVTEIQTIHEAAKTCQLLNATGKKKETVGIEIRSRGEATKVSKFKSEESVHRVYGKHCS